MIDGDSIFAPRTHTGQPAAYVATILVVVGAELSVQRRLFVEEHEQMDAEGHGGDGRDGDGVGVTEDDPEADPASGETDVHGIAHVAVKADNDQALGWSDGSGGAAPGPAEVPYASQGDGKSKHRGDGSEPSPACGARGFHAEAEPLRQQPEPQREERCADRQGGQGG